MPLPSGSLSRASRKVLDPVLLTLAVCVVLVDDAFRAFVIPAVQALARVPLVRWCEQVIARLPPYGILMLFLIPLAIIEPFKIYALYLFSLGHFASGLLTFFVAKVVGLGLAERLFAIGRDKLLTIGWFAWCFTRGVAIRDFVHGWLEGTWAWRQAHRIAGTTRAMLARAGSALARLLPQERRRGRLAAAFRRVRQRPIL